MGFDLAIYTFNGLRHPPAKFDSLAAADKAARDAIRDGYYRFPENVVLVTGPGTVYHLSSDEQLQKQTDKEERELKKFCVAVQSGAQQLPPLQFDDEDEMRKVVEGGVRGGVLMHCQEVDHEYIYLHLAQGSVLVSMTMEEYVRRMKEAHAQRLAKEQPRIVLPK